MNSSKINIIIGRVKKSVIIIGKCSGILLLFGLLICWLVGREEVRIRWCPNYHIVRVLLGGQEQTSSYNIIKYNNYMIILYPFLLSE